MAGGKSESEWATFVAWCKQRRLKALPAHPWTVAAYARWCEARHGFPVVAGRIRAIARAHVLSCAPPPDRDPLVARTLMLIERRDQTRPQRASLFSDAGVASPSEASHEEADDDARAAVTTRWRAMRASPRLVRRRPTGS